MSCAPSTGLYLADLETPNAKVLAAKTKANCARVLKERRLPERDRDLTEAEVAALITRRGGAAIDCAEPALAYVEHVTKVHRKLVKTKRRIRFRNSDLKGKIDSQLAVGSAIG